MIYIHKILRFITKNKFIISIPTITIAVFIYISGPFNNSYSLTLGSFSKKTSASAVMFIKYIDNGLVKYDLEIRAPRMDYSKILISRPFIYSTSFQRNYFETKHELSFNINNKYHPLSKIIDITELKDTLVYRFQNLNLTIPSNMNQTNLYISLVDSINSFTAKVEKLKIINQYEIMELKAFSPKVSIKDLPEDLDQNIKSSHDNFFSFFNVKFGFRTSYLVFVGIFILIILTILGFVHYKLRKNAHKYDIIGFLIAIAFGLLPLLDSLNENHPNVGSIISLIRYVVYIWIGVIILDALTRLKENIKVK